ncbi:MAG: ATP-binding protein [Candidatus Korobacteraceae bacterium]
MKGAFWLQRSLLPGKPAMIPSSPVLIAKLTAAAASAAKECETERRENQRLCHENARLREGLQQALQQADQDCAARQEQLRIAERAAKAAAFDWDLKSHADRSSPELYALYGRTQEEMGPGLEGWLRHMHPEDRPAIERAVARAIQDRAALEIEFRVIRPDGELVWMAAQGLVQYDADEKPARLVGITIDVTERKRAQEAMIAAEKIASAGRMAATIAHEINNPLEAVTNLIFLAASDAQISPTTREYLEMAQDELRRVSHTARQTLGFYRESAAPSPTQVDALVQEVLSLYNRRLAQQSIKLQARLRSRATIRAVGGEIRQVVSNLIANAADACGVGARITVGVADCTLRDGAKGVRITVADSGSGIANSVRARIFEPFFTTKRAVGTGLGLWVTRSLVEKHGGSIRVRSTEGRGTVFCVFLPAQGPATANSQAMRAA